MLFNNRGAKRYCCPNCKEFSKLWFKSLINYRSKIERSRSYKKNKLKKLEEMQYYKTDVSIEEQFEALLKQLLKVDGESWHIW